MSDPTATVTPPMPNPAPASTPPPPQHTSANPDTPDTIKKRSLSDVGSDSPGTEGGIKLSIGHGTGNAVSVGTGAAGPAKKRTKLTEAEKEAREKEKLEREKERVAKEKERFARKAERDEKRRIKDEEKKKKDDEMAKKEKAQMRIGSFFTKPTTGPTPPSTTSSTANTSATRIIVGSPPPSDVKLKEQGRTDYERSFQPFFVKPNVTVASVPFERDDDYKLVVKNALDNALSLPECLNSTGGTGPGSGWPAAAEIGEGLTIKRVEELMRIPQYKCGRRGKLPKYSTKDILARINAPDSSSLPPIVDLEIVNQNEIYSVYLDLLNSLPYKFLRFAEDVRPPYSGTYTRRPTSSGLLRGRNPFQRSLPRVDYEYDSEAEWEEEGLDGDAEELLSDEEDDEDGDSGDDDLGEFLDDEDEESANKNRRGVVSALVPICSGLCWEDSIGKTPRKEFEEMRLGILIGGVPGPIDPFSTSYWNPVAPSQLPPGQVANNAHNAITQFFPITGNGKPQSTMLPPGPPVCTAQATAGEHPKKKAKPAQLVPTEEMSAFKQAIEGSDLTKAAMIEHLKKKFPQLHKEAIKNSLGQVAQRRGKTEKDKRWVLC